MERLPKLDLYTKEEILQQYKDKKINLEFMAEYIETIIQTYNILINNVNNYQEKYEKATDYYYKELYNKELNNDHMPKEAVDLFNILEGDK